MGKHDRRNSMKMKRKKAQVKKLARAKKNKPAPKAPPATKGKREKAASAS